MTEPRDWWGDAGAPDVVRVLRERELTDEEIAAERARTGLAALECDLFDGTCAWLEPTVEELCSSCSGSGEGMADGTRCARCRGWGEVLERRACRGCEACG